MKSGGRQLGITVLTSEIRSSDDIDLAFSEAVRRKVDGIVVAASVVVIDNRARIIEQAAKLRLPAVYGDELFAYDGGLISYWTSITDMHKAAAGLVAKILQGAKPGDLPVQSPTKFELAINLKTAKTLGLMVSPTLLVRADEVIE